MRPVARRVLVLEIYDSRIIRSKKALLRRSSFYRAKFRFRPGGACFGLSGFGRRVDQSGHSTLAKSMSAFNHIAIFILAELTS